MDDIGSSHSTSWNGLKTTNHFVPQHSLTALIGDDKKPTTGKDTMGQIMDFEVTAHVLADFLANPKLEQPLTLGIMGELGSGKSYFTNLMKQRFIDIQKMKVDGEDDSAYVGHLYYITFDAWTFGNQDLWASLMFRIFQSLNEQLLIEAKLTETKDLRQGGLSVIELFDKLSKVEKEYFKSLEADGITNIEEALRNAKQTDSVSESFSNIFAAQMQKDDEDLKTAEKELKEKSNLRAWDLLKERREEISNTCLRVVLDHIKNATEDDWQKWKRKTFGEVYKTVPFHNKLIALVNPLYLAILVIAIVAIVVITLQKYPYGDTVLPYVIALVTTIGASILNTDIRKKIKDGSVEFLDTIKTVQNSNEGTIPDIEASLKTNYAEIGAEQMKIAEIRGRFKVLEGDSVQTVVKHRLDNNVLSNPGIVHQAQQDLIRLSECIDSHYKQDSTARKKKMFPRGRPRIVLHVDDLQKCEPDKVVEVLEAIQFLVRMDLFVVIVVIDHRHACLSFENNKCYKEILQTHRSPTSSMQLLEMFIQVPFCLPSKLDDRFMKKYVMDLLEMEEEGRDNNSDQQPGTAATATTKDITKQFGPLSQDDNKKSKGGLESIDSDSANSQTIQDVPSSTANSSTIKRSVDKQEGAQDCKDLMIAGFEEQRFTKMEADILLKACLSFNLIPRSIKRITTIFKIMKLTWHRKGTYEKEKAFTEHYLLLLAMASSKEISDGMQRIFNMMENPELSSEDDRADNLFELLKGECGLPESTHDLLRCVEIFKIRTLQDWRETSRRFEVVRSFSFFHTLDKEGERQGTNREVALSRLLDLIGKMDE